MFSAFQTFGRLGAGARAVAAAWTPAALWPTGTEPGMWIDPSNLVSQWQDSTGTTPVVTPGTVADWSNPVGLALDLRLGAPTTLGPELVTNGDFSDGGSGWTAPSHWTFVNNRAEKTSGSDGEMYQYFAGAPGKLYEISWDQYTGGLFALRFGSAAGNTLLAIGSGSYVTRAYLAGDAVLRFEQGGTTAGDWIDNVSVREVPGNHLFQATSTARPLLSARVNLLTYTEDFSNAVWNPSNGNITVSGNKLIPTVTFSNHYISQGSAAVGVTHTISVIAKQSGYAWMKLVAHSQYANFNLSTGELGVNYSGVSRTITAVGDGSYICTFTFVSASDANGQGCIIKIGSGDNAGWDSASFSGNGVDGIEIYDPQLELGTTATPYQAILTDGSTYTSTGITPFQLYDGVDDSMATASFAAGTLTSAMDCMIAVRRDSDAVLYGVVGMQNQPQAVCFGIYAIGSSDPCFFGCGTPTVWVDGVQLPAGSKGELYTALPVGDWHILEFRGLDLSAWTKATFGEWGGGVIFNGAQGGILLFPSSTSTADRDAARTWLGAKVGLTL